MPYFADADDVYAHIGKLFQDVAADPELGPRLRRADCTVQQRLRRPDALVTVRMGGGEEPLQADLGQSTLPPDVVLQMDADIAHRLWLGRINMAVALARGEIRARGPSAAVLRLIPLIGPLAERYQAQLEGAGREDLANVS
jgi:hypothetical protein